MSCSVVPVVGPEMEFPWYSLERNKWPRKLRESYSNSYKNNYNVKKIQIEKLLEKNCNSPKRSLLLVVVVINFWHV
jgi:hypothetical protein